MSLVLVWSATTFAQAVAARSGGYDTTAEITVRGTIGTVVSAPGPTGVVGVHMDLKTSNGPLSVQVGPAQFIGQSNFWFAAEDEVEIVGAMVTHGGRPVLWVRTITKAGKTLKLRDVTGAPLWKIDGQADPDGCGVSHPPML